APSFCVCEFNIRFSQPEVPNVPAAERTALNALGNIAITKENILSQKLVDCAYPISIEKDKTDDRQQPAWIEKTVTLLMLLDTEIVERSAHFCRVHAIQYQKARAKFILLFRHKYDRPTARFQGHELFDAQGSTPSDTSAYKTAMPSLHGNRHLTSPTRKLVTKLQPSVGKRTSVLNTDVLTIKRKFGDNSHGGNFGIPSSLCAPLKTGEACQPITNSEAKHLIDQKTNVRCFQPMAAERLASVPRCRNDTVYGVRIGKRTRADQRQSVRYIDYSGSCFWGVSLQKTSWCLREAFSLHLSGTIRPVLITTSQSCSFGTPETKRRCAEFLRLQIEHACVNRNRNRRYQLSGFQERFPHLGRNMDWANETEELADELWNSSFSADCGGIGCPTVQTSVDCCPQLAKEVILRSILHHTLQMFYTTDVGIICPERVYDGSILETAALAMEILSLFNCQHNTTCLMLLRTNSDHHWFGMIFEMSDDGQLTGHYYVDDGLGRHKLPVRLFAFLSDLIQLVYQNTMIKFVPHNDNYVPQILQSTQHSPGCSLEVVLHLVYMFLCCRFQDDIVRSSLLELYEDIPRVLTNATEEDKPSVDDCAQNGGYRTANSDIRYSSQTEKSILQTANLNKYVSKLLKDLQKASQRVVLKDSSVAVAYLVNIMEFDESLRLDAFRLLSVILPFGYSTNRRYAFDHKIILNYFSSNSLSTRDLALFITKDKTIDLSGVVDLLLDRISTCPDAIEEAAILGELTSLASVQTYLANPDLELLLLQLAQKTDEFAVRKRLLAIFEKIVPASQRTQSELYMLLKHLEHVFSDVDGKSTQQLVSHLHHIVASGHRLTGAQVTTLAKRLATEKPSSTYRRDLAEFLLHTDVEPKVCEDITTLLDIIKDYPDLLLSGRTVEILQCGITTGFGVSVMVSEAALKKFVQHLFDVSITPDIPIELMRILSEHRRWNEHALERLDIVTRQPINHTCLIRTMLHTLCKQDKGTLLLSIAQLENYYREVCKQLWETETGPSELTSFIHQDENIAYSLSLLTVLCDINFLGIPVSMEIFSDYATNEWRCMLLACSLQQLVWCPPEGDDPAVFMRHLNRLVEVFGQDGRSNILHVLLNDPDIETYDLGDLNEILQMCFESGPAVLTTIVDDSFKLSTHLELLQIHWLSNLLSKVAVLFEHDDLVSLNNHTAHISRQLLDTVIANITPGTDIKELVGFFSKLSKADLCDADKEDLLENLPRNTQIVDWYTLMYVYLVDDIMSAHLHNYEALIQSEKSISEPLYKNAYSESEDPDYWYTADDIVTIGEAWMADFHRSCRIIWGLDLKEAEEEPSRLVEVFDSYNRSRQPTIIVLNFAQLHWVVVACYPEGAKIVVLYKDSLGEHNCVAEREKVQNLFETGFAQVEFHYHPEKEQQDNSSCGPFVLSNMKLLAGHIQQKQANSKFETLRFTKQTDVKQLRTVEFPKCYAWTVARKCWKENLRKMHHCELDAVRRELAAVWEDRATIGLDGDLEKTEVEPDIFLSIDFPEQELFLDESYTYFYKIHIRRPPRGVLRNNIYPTLLIIFGESSVVPNPPDGFLIKAREVSFLGGGSPVKQPGKSLHFLSGVQQREVLRMLGLSYNYLERQKLLRILGIIAVSEGNLPNQVQDTLISDELIVRDLRDRFIQLMLFGWNHNSVERLLKLLLHLCPEGLRAFINTLDIVCEYRLREYERNRAGRSLISFLNEPSSAALEREVHRLAIECRFPGTADKTVSEIVHELVERNRGSETDWLNEQNLLGEHEKVLRAYSGRSLLVPEFKSIEHWKRNSVQNWAMKVKQQDYANHPDRIYEVVAVLKRAVEVSSHFTPRDVQLVALLCLLNPQPHKGRLLQVDTGEGKTTIVAMFAAAKALQGHKVDIVTSSAELAVPQSEQQREFYSLFGLTVGHNSRRKGSDQARIIKCYKNDIVYGAAEDFQADLLRQEFSRITTRDTRSCDVVIIDEVDSMLIDGRNSLVRLSSTMPAMNYLEPILAIIWLHIEQVGNGIVVEDGQTFYKRIKKPASADGTTNETSEQLEVDWIPITVSKAEFLKQTTVDHVRKLLRFETDVSKDYPEMKVPNHLRRLVSEYQLSRWVDSAISAKYRYENGKHYIVREGKIAIVDAANTGVVHSSMHWSDGLHQFLQMKHGARISPETLTSNYLSNVSYFHRYGESIFGLTGTLGSGAAQKMLQVTYNVDCVNVPPFREKQHYELIPRVVDNENEWYATISTSCLNKLRNHRGVLIITQYIETCRKLEQHFQQLGVNANKIKVYASGDDSSVIGDELDCGEVIIATNIAGRGADIKPTRDVEKNGGMHVCITFLPENERVERQNVGRTSRTGNKGTSQFIIQHSNSASIEWLRTRRDRLQMAVLASAISQIRSIVMRDSLFGEFCLLLHEFEDKFEAKAIEERFAIWLKMQQDLIENNETENVAARFREFVEQIRDDQRMNCLIRNPYVYTLRGNQLLQSGDYVKAHLEYDKAIELDPEYSETAHYNRAYVRLYRCGGVIAQNESKIQDAIEDLKQARQLIRGRLDDLNLVGCISHSKVLAQQIAHKHNIFGIMLNAIEAAIGPKDDLIEGAIGQALTDKNNELKTELVPLLDALSENVDINLLDEELQEFTENGYFGVFHVSVRPPIPWGSVIGMSLIGLTQILIGASLAVFCLGPGTGIGIGLIAEGVGDLITAVKSGIIDRNIDWKAWGVQKAVSLVVTVVCAGVGAALDAAMSLRSVGAQLLRATAQISKCTASCFSTALKAVGAGLAKGVVKELVTNIANYGLAKLIVPKIRQILDSCIKPWVEKNILKNPIVARLLELDLKNGTNEFCAKVKQTILELLTPQEGSTNVLCKIGQEEIPTAHTCTERTGVDPPADDIDLDKGRMSQEQVDLEQKCEQSRLSELRQSLSDIISAGMSTVISDKILSPLVDYGLMKGVNKGFSGWDRSIQAEIEHNKQRRRLVLGNDRRFAQRIRKIYAENELSMDDRQKAAEFICQQGAGSEANLIALCYAADLLDRPIKLVDEKGNVIHNIRGKAKGEPMVIQYNKEEKHFCLPGNKDPILPSKSGVNGANNCLYNVLANHTGLDANEIRLKVTQGMAQNWSTLVHQVKDYHALANYNKRAQLSGGRRPDKRRPFRPLDQDNYGFYDDRVVKCESFLPMLNKMAIELDGALGEYLEFEKKSSRAQNKFTDHTGFCPKFTRGQLPESKGIMLGAMEVKFTNGETLKLLTLAGQNPLIIAQMKDGTSKEFSFSHNGFQLVNPKGDIVGSHIFHPFDKKTLGDAKYNTRCAAQKLMFMLGEHMKANPHLNIDGSIKMTEAWYGFHRKDIQTLHQKSNPKQYKRQHQTSDKKAEKRSQRPLLISPRAEKPCTECDSLGRATSTKKK
ncbi:protein translocase subunit secA, partial [Clonorchis sinensis]